MSDTKSKRDNTVEAGKLTWQKVRCASKLTHEQLAAVWTSTRSWRGKGLRSVPDHCSWMLFFPVFIKPWQSCALSLLVVLELYSGRSSCGAIVGPIQNFVRPTMPILHSTLAESRDYSSHLMSSKGAIINLFFLKKEKKDLKKSLYHVMSAWQIPNFQWGPYNLFPTL